MFQAGCLRQAGPRYHFLPVLYTERRQSVATHVGRWRRCRRRSRDPVLEMSKRCRSAREPALPHWEVEGNPWNDCQVEIRLGLRLKRRLNIRLFWATASRSISIFLVCSTVPKAAGALRLRVIVKIVVTSLPSSLPPPTHDGGRVGPLHVSSRIAAAGSVGSWAAVLWYL